MKEDARRDCCRCQKQRGVYGRGPFHLRNNGDPTLTANDAVVERCPEWKAARNWVKKLEDAAEQYKQRINQTTDDAELCELMAKLDRGEQELRGWKRKLLELRGIASDIDQVLAIERRQRAERTGNKQPKAVQNEPPRVEGR